MIYTAIQVAQASAALLNDKNMTIFTFSDQLPFLNMAMRELQEECEKNNIPVTSQTEIDIEVPAGETTIAFNAEPLGPELPFDLIDIRQMYERNSGSAQNYIPMQRVEFLPPIVTQTQQLVYWAWINQEVKFIGSTNDIQVRIDYIRDCFTPLSDEQDEIEMINAMSFLQYRLAGLCARFIGENSDRSDELNLTAGLALERLLTIGIKGKQAIFIRRRPFMARYKLMSNSL